MKNSALTRWPPRDEAPSTELTNQFGGLGGPATIYPKGFDEVHAALKYLRGITHWDEEKLGPQIPTGTFITAYELVNKLAPRYAMPDSLSPHDGGILMEWRKPQGAVLIGIETGTIRLTVFERNHNPIHVEEQAFVDFIPQNIQAYLISSISRASAHS